MGKKCLAYLMVIILGSSFDLLAETECKVVDVQKEKGETASLKVEKTINIPPIIIDRMDIISIGTISDGTNAKAKFFYQAPQYQGGRNKKYLAVRSNTHPVLMSTSIPAQCMSSAEIDLSVEAMDANGDAIWYRWVCLPGSLMLSSTETAHNRFRAPYLAKGETATVDVLVQVTDSYGQSAMVTKNIKVLGTGASTSYVQAFMLDLKEPLFSGKKISSLTFHGKNIHATDERDNYYTVSPVDRVVQKSKTKRFRNIMSDGLSLYGIKEDSFFSLGRPAAKSLLEFSTLGIRKQRTSILSRFAAPNTVYILDSANKLVDVYELADENLQCRRTYHIPLINGSLVSGDSSYPRVWCSLTSDSRMLITELFNGTTRELKTGIDRGVQLAEIAAGPTGSIAARRSDGRGIYIGDIFSGKPFASVQSPLSNLKLSATSMHWIGEELMIGTEPCGISIYNPATRELKHLGNARNRDVTHITFLEGGTLLAYDDKIHTFVTYDKWGMETGFLKLDAEMRIDDLDAGRNGQVIALDEKTSSVRIFSLSDQHASSVQHVFQTEGPDAVCMGEESFAMVAGDTRGIGFAGERMMFISAYLDDVSDKDAVQISNWHSSKKAKGRSLSMDQDKDIIAAANNISKSVCIKMPTHQGIDSMRVFSFDSLGLGQVSNIEVMNGLIYILDVYPSVEVVIIDAASGQAVHRWSLDISRDSELAVTEGHLVVLDRKSQRMFWNKIK